MVTGILRRCAGSGGSGGGGLARNICEIFAAHFCVFFFVFCHLHLFLFPFFCVSSFGGAAFRFCPFFLFFFFWPFGVRIEGDFCAKFHHFFCEGKSPLGFFPFFGGRSMSDLWRPMNDDPIGIGADSLPFYWLASLTEFYRVLPGFTGFRADRGHISRFDRVSSRANRVLPSFTGF